MYFICKGRELMNLLYTVVPLERIYADLRRKNNNSGKGRDADEQNTNDRNAKDNLQYRDILLPHGRIVARQDGDNYVVEKICSTDMSDYLNEDYTPGKIVKS
jgi:hypothetical protein